MLQLFLNIVEFGMRPPRLEAPSRPAEPRRSVRDKRLSIARDRAYPRQ